MGDPTHLYGLAWLGRYPLGYAVRVIERSLESSQISGRDRLSQGAAIADIELETSVAEQVTAPRNVVTAPFLCSRTSVLGGSLAGEAVSLPQARKRDEEED